MGSNWSEWEAIDFNILALKAILAHFEDQEFDVTKGQGPWTNAELLDEVCLSDDALEGLKYLGKRPIIYLTLNLNKNTNNKLLSDFPNQKNVQFYTNHHNRKVIAFFVK